MNADMDVERVRIMELVEQGMPAVELSIYRALMAQIPVVTADDKALPGQDGKAGGGAGAQQCIHQINAVRAVVSTVTSEMSIAPSGAVSLAFCVLSLNKTSDLVNKLTALIMAALYPDRIVDQKEMLALRVSGDTSDEALRAIMCKGADKEAGDGQPADK